MRSKKWIALILSACMMISGTNVSVFAESTASFQTTALTLPMNIQMMPKVW
mgnify:CR=1 FL=1